MDDSRAPETASLICYQRKRKFKDLGTEYEPIKKYGKQNLEQTNLDERERFAQMQRDVEEFKRKCMDMEGTTNSFIKENASLRRELDSTSEQLKNLQKCHEEADMKYEADVELLMKENKSLRSSQSELRQELYRVEKERTPSWWERTGASSVLDIIGLNSLPDDVLVAILSRMSLVEAVRTSILSRRWRHLWRFTSGSLDFDVIEIKTRPLMDAGRTSVLSRTFGSSSLDFGVVKTNTRPDADEVITWVDHVIKLHQGPHLDNFIVRFNRGGVYDDTIRRWIYFAMQKEVKKFELKLGDSYLNKPLTRKVVYVNYHNDFPKLKELLSLKCAFVSLRSLKLESVDITDKVVHYLLASCPNLESLSITRSHSTKNLEIFDPIPKLKSLEISSCYYLESLKVSATSIVSFSFKGVKEYDDNKLIFENIPNLTELTLTGYGATSFIYEYEDNIHASCSVQLVKLSLYLFTTKYTWAVPHNLPLLYALKRLELSTECQVGRSLLFFNLLIKAAPVLHEFRIEVNYNYNPHKLENLIPFPVIGVAEAPAFHHENLKLVELVGYIGCPSEEEFLVHLFKVALSLEKVVIEVVSAHFDEKSELYCHKKLRQRIGARTVKEAKERAKHLRSAFPPKTQLVIK